MTVPDQVEVSDQYTWALPGKMVSYPTVSLTMDTVSSLYEATKGYNRLTGMAAGVAEKTAQTAWGMSTPILRKFEPTLMGLDKYATDQLLALEQKAPIINEQPGEIYKVMKEGTVETLNNSVAGKMVSSALQPVLSVAEKAVQPEESGRSEGGDDDAEKPEAPKDARLSPEDVSLEQTLSRVVTISGKLQRRAMDKAIQQIQYISQRSSETIQTMRETVDLIQYARTLEDSLAPGVNRAREFIHELVKDEDLEFDDTMDEETKERKRQEAAKGGFERRTLVLARNLTRQLDQGAESLITYSKDRIPTTLSSQLVNMHTLIRGMRTNFQQANGFKDLSDTFLEQTKSNITLISQTMKEYSLETADYIVTSRPLSWVVPKESAKLLSELRRESRESTSSYSPSDSMDEVDDSEEFKTPAVDGKESPAAAPADLDQSFEEK